MTTQENELFNALKDLVSAIDNYWTPARKEADTLPQDPDYTSVLNTARNLLAKPIYVESQKCHIEIGPRECVAQLGEIEINHLMRCFDKMISSGVTPQIKITRIEG